MTTKIHKMRVVLFLMSVLLAPPLLAREPRDLAQKIAQLAGHAGLQGMRVGIRVETLGPRRAVIFEQNSHELFTPASNQKLLTTACALCTLPMDFKYQTILAKRNNDLIVIGAGDPSIGDPRMAEEADERPDQLFVDWANTLKRQKLSLITGDLIFDDFVFDQETLSPSWVGEFNLQTWYAAPVGGLNFNDNCVDVIISPAKQRGNPGILRLFPDCDWVRLKNSTKTAQKGEPLIARRGDGPLEIVASGSVSRANSAASPLSIAIVDPGSFFAHTCKAVFEREGVRITGTVRRQMIRQPGAPLPNDLRLIAIYEQPWTNVLWRINKSSINMFAESLLKTMGAVAGAKQPVRQGSYANGQAAMQRVLKSMGIEDDQYHIVDGSGLSRDNRVSPAAITAILQAMDRHAQRELWWDDLAEPNEATGTLKRRMKNLQGRVFAKTGHIRGVSALSGYVVGPDQTRYAFSVLCNDTHKSKQGGTAAHRLQDSLCALLASTSQTAAATAPAP